MILFARIRSLVVLVLIACLVLDPQLANALSHPEIHSSINTAELFKAQALAAHFLLADHATARPAFSLRKDAGAGYRAQTHSASVIAQELHRRFHLGGGIFAKLLWLILLPAIVPYELTQIAATGKLRYQRKIFINRARDKNLIKRWWHTAGNIFTGYSFRTAQSHIGAWPVFPSWVRVSGYVTCVFISAPFFIHLLTQVFNGWIVHNESLIHVHAVIFAIFVNSVLFALGHAGQRLRRNSTSISDASMIFRRIAWVGGIGFNLLFTSVLIGHFIAHNPWGTALVGWKLPWNSVALSYVMVINGLFWTQEVLANLILKRGNLYSLRFQYDEKGFGQLLTESEGQRRLNQSVKSYVVNSPEEEAPYVGLVRIDNDFYKIAESRIGLELANRLRERIYAYFVEGLRREFPGTLIAKTRDQNELMINLPPRVDARQYEAGVHLLLQDLYQRWLHAGYYVVDFPQLSQLKQSLSADHWNRVMTELEERGVFWSEHNGGKALLLKTRIERVFPSERPSVPIEDVQVALNTVFEIINRNKKHFGLNGNQLDRIDVDANEKEYPPHEITVSVAITGVRQCFEMAAWSSAEGSTEAMDLGLKSSNARRVMLELDKQERIDRTLGAVERVLQTWRKRTPDQHSYVTVLDHPYVAEDGSPQIHAMRTFVNPLRPLNDGNGISGLREDVLLNLLPSDLSKRMLPSQWVAPLASREVAELDLKTRSVTLSEAGRLQRAKWDRMLEVYRNLLRHGTAARVLATFISGMTVAQAQGYLRAIPRDAFPSVTLEGVHNPIPKEQNVYPFFPESTGNGMAVLNVSRETFRHLVTDRPHGEYDFREEVLKDDVVIGLYGAGESSRSAGFSHLGKPAGKVPTQFQGALSRRGVATMADILMVEGLTLADALPRQVNGRKNGGSVVVYGDNAKPFDVDSLREHFKGLHAANGFTLVLGEVPYYESIKWGVASLETDGRVNRFYEKPVPDMTKDERAWLNTYIAARDELRPEQRRHLESDLLPRIRKHLKELKLINEKSDGTATIFMNAGFGIKGAGAEIRFMQLAGAQFEFNESGTHIKIKESHNPTETTGELPMTPGDPYGHYALSEETLVQMLDDKSLNIGSLRERLRNHLSTLQRDPAQPGSPDEMQVLRNTLEYLNSNSVLLPEAREILIRRLRLWNNKLSVFQGYLRDGLELDAMGDIVPKMAVDPMPGDQLFSKALKLLESGSAAVAKLQGTNAQDSDSTSVLQRYQTAVSDMKQKLKVFNLSRPSAVTEKELEPVMDNLLVQMARVRGIYRSRSLETDADAELAILKLVYQGYATAFWNCRLWQVLRSDIPGEPMPYVCGFVSNGVWFDMGASKDIWENFTASSVKGALVFVGLGFKAMLRSSLKSAVPSTEVIMDDDLDLPGRMQNTANLVNCWIGGRYDPVQNREWRMEAGSRAENTQFPWGGQLLRNVNVAEGVIERRESVEIGLGYREVTRHYVVHTLWNHSSDTEPGKNDVFMNRHLLPYRDEEGAHPGWLEENYVYDHASGEPAGPEDLWNVPDLQAPGSIQWKPSDKKVLFEAKLFPGISYELMMASMNMHDVENKPLAAYARDPLDWDLFRNMPSIWGWLQGDSRFPSHDADGHPAVWFRIWQKAKDQGRLFSMRDHYSLRGQGIASDRRREQIQKVLEERLNKTYVESVMVPTHYITGLSADRVTELYPREDTPSLSHPVEIVSVPFLAVLASVGLVGLVIPGLHAYSAWQITYSNFFASVVLMSLGAAMTHYFPKIFKKESERVSLRRQIAASV